MLEKRCSIADVALRALQWRLLCRDRLQGLPPSPKGYRRMGKAAADHDVDALTFLTIHLLILLSP